MIRVVRSDDSASHAHTRYRAARQSLSGRHRRIVNNPALSALNARSRNLASRANENDELLGRNEPAAWVQRHHLMVFASGAIGRRASGACRAIWSVLSRSAGIAGARRRSRTLGDYFVDGGTRDVPRRASGADGARCGRRPREDLASRQNSVQFMEITNLQSRRTRARGPRLSNSYCARCQRCA